MTAVLPYGVARRKQWARRLLLRTLTAPQSVSDDERLALARWLDYAARGGERKPFSLRLAMQQRGWTATILAAKLGVTARLVRYWLRGERQPSADMGRLIAHAFGIEPLKLLPNFGTQRIRSNAPVLRPSYDPSQPLRGANLAAARRACGVTQKALASQLDIAPLDIAACERGGHSALQRVQHAVVKHLDARGIPAPPGAARGRGRPRTKVVAPKVV